MTIETIKERCRKCGGEIKIEIDVSDSLIANVARGMIKSMVCDECGERMTAERKATETRAYLLEIFEKSGIPKGRSRFDISKCVCLELHAFVMDNLNKSLWVADTNGTGKTWAVCAGAVEKIKNQHCKVIYRRAVDAANEYACAYEDGSKAAESYVKRLSMADLLILDDLGKEKLTEKGKEFLFRIIDARYDAKRQIWITTNHSGDELSERLGDNYGNAILRRLRERCVSWKN